MTSLIPSNWSLLLHLLSTGLALGVMFWHTFFNGPLSFKELKRSTFSTLQGRLFPYYFSVLTGCHTIQVFTLSCLNASGKIDLNTDAYLLIGALVLNLVNQVVIGPKVTAIMMKRLVFLLRMESAQPGSEQSSDDKAEFARLNGQFGPLHGVSSLFNLAQFIFVLVHVSYLSNALRV